jgi:putative ABC transport system permease protein
VKLLQQLSRVAALLRPGTLDADLDREILAHLDLAERDALATGMSPEQARIEARRRFGGVAQMKDAHRDHRTARWIETFLKDLRYGLVSLVHAPGFAVVAIGVLAVGIGAATAMFSVLDSVLLRPMPYSDPDRIVRIWETPTPTTVNQTTNGFFYEWRRRSTSFEAMAANRPSRFNLIIGGEPTRLSGLLATADYFDVFRVKALMGRTFSLGDDQPGAVPVVVLSHAAWQQRFGGDPNILSRDLLFDEQRYRVIGVLPPGSFDREPTHNGPNELADFWIPLVFTPDDLTRAEHQNDVVARLRAGVTLAQAQQEMLAIRAGLATVTPTYKKDWSVAVEPFDLRLVGDGLRRTLYVSFGAVLFVLLITSANIANLLLAKGAARSKEMAVRAALGASRGRLLTQLLTESLVLCSLGGVGGVVVAWLLMQAATPILPTDLPSYADVALSWRVLGFTSAIALGASLIVGTFPSIRASSVAPGSAMSQGARGSSASHEGLRRGLVIAEVAVSIVLMCGALLLFKSLVKMQRVAIGAGVDNVLTMSADLPRSSYPTPARAVQFMDDAVARLSAVPGVILTSVSSDLPLGGSGGESLTLPGRMERVLVRFKRIDSEYFRALAIPLIAGRAIGMHDRAGAPLSVVINDTLARRLGGLGMTNPVGKTIRLPALAYEPRLGAARVDFQIVGVVQNERIRSDLRLPIDAESAVYVALAQFPKQELKIIVRTSGDPSAVWTGIREAMKAIDPQLPLGDVRTMAQVKARSLSGVSVPTWVIGTFAAIAVLLSALGLYGVLAHSVTRQRREIGIRMALGASSRDVLMHVVSNASAMVLIGLAAGFAGAFGLTRLTKALLYDVSPLDPAVFVGAGLTMIGVSLLAALLPAFRATRVDPTTALRAED